MGMMMYVRKRSKGDYIIHSHILFSIIGIFSLTGFFEWGAVQAFKLSRGK